jgi:hypothetical protein
VVRLPQAADPQVRQGAAAAAACCTACCSVQPRPALAISLPPRQRPAEGCVALRPPGRASATRRAGAATTAAPRSPTTRSTSSSTSPAAASQATATGPRWAAGRRRSWRGRCSAGRGLLLLMDASLTRPAGWLQGFYGVYESLFETLGKQEAQAWDTREERSGGAAPSIPKWAPPPLCCACCCCCCPLAAAFPTLRGWDSAASPAGGPGQAAAMPARWPLVGAHAPHAALSAPPPPPLLPLRALAPEGPKQGPCKPRPQLVPSLPSACPQLALHPTFPPPCPQRPSPGHPWPAGLTGAAAAAALVL